MSFGHNWVLCQRAIAGCLMKLFGFWVQTDLYLLKISNKCCSDQFPGSPSNVFILFLSATKCAFTSVVHYIWSGPKATIDCCIFQLFHFLFTLFARVWISRWAGKRHQNAATQLMWEHLHYSQAKCVLGHISWTVLPFVKVTCRKWKYPMGYHGCQSPNAHPYPIMQSSADYSGFSPKLCSSSSSCVWLRLDCLFGPPLVCTWLRLPHSCLPKQPEPKGKPSSRLATAVKVSLESKTPQNYLIKWQTSAQVTSLYFRTCEKQTQRKQLLFRINILSI